MPVMSMLYVFFTFIMIWGQVDWCRKPLLCTNNVCFVVIHPAPNMCFHATMLIFMSSNSQTVCTASTMCKELGISFPEINVTRQDETTPNDFYVFKGLKEAPTVIHIPLFNVKNCGRLCLSIHTTCCTHAVQFIKKDVTVFYRAV